MTRRVGQVRRMVTDPEMRRRDQERDAHDQKRNETRRTRHEPPMVVSLDGSQVSAVIVAVVKIGQMGVRVQHRSVTVTMPMTPDDERFVAVVGVMAVVVRMIMLVFHQGMLVVVFVIAPQDKTDADQRDDQRDHLPGVHRFTEQQPRCCGSDKRGGSKHKLASGSSEFTRSGDPQGDRGAVPDAANQQRGRDVSILTGRVRGPVRGPSSLRRRPFLS